MVAVGVGLQASRPAVKEKLNMDKMQAKTATKMESEFDEADFDF